MADLQTRSSVRLRFLRLCWKVLVEVASTLLTGPLAILNKCRVFTSMRLFAISRAGLVAKVVRDIRVETGVSCLAPTR